jgi:electron transfer flavoprotein alpha subunit
LLLADVRAGHVLDATAKALTAARALGAPVDVLVLGSQSEAAAHEAARLEGVASVLLAASTLYDHGLAEPVSELIVALAPGYDAFVASSSSTAKSVMPRVAARLDVMQVSEVTNVLGPDQFERSIYAGNAVQTVRSLDPKRVLTVRTTAFPAAPSREAEAPLSAAPSGPDPGSSIFVSDSVRQSARPELTAAKIVVSGGRAVQSAENFEKLIIPLADRLGAAVGASRAAVDAGYAPNDWQVGQTGKAVAPDLYVAVGISGAIQHLAGMKDSKVIVAINKDAEAPIFQVADYGLVQDLFTALPELERELSHADR